MLYLLHCYSYSSLNYFLRQGLNSRYRNTSLQGENAKIYKARTMH